MTLDDDITILRTQELALQFAAFSADTAWHLGSRMRDLALQTPKPVAIGIWLAGQTLLYTGTNGITASNEDWLRRKRNTVLRFGRSSMLVGSELQKSGSTLEAKQGLTLADYAAHGGGFPITLRGTGCLGAIVVSGLTQREDHSLVIKAVSEALSVDVAQLP